MNIEKHLQEIQEREYNIYKTEFEVTRIMQQESEDLRKKIDRDQKALKKQSEQFTQQMRLESEQMQKKQAEMAIQLKYKQDKAVRDNLEAYAKAQYELQQQDVKSEVSSDRISYGTTYHQPT